jgi:hypothetical protein
MLHHYIDSNLAITVQKHSENEVWKMYLKEIEADDKRMTDAWKQDAKGLLTFVSPKLLISVFVSITSPRQVSSPQLLPHLSLNSTKSWTPVLIQVPTRQLNHLIPVDP